MQCCDGLCWCRSCSGSVVTLADNSANRGQNKKLCAKHMIDLMLYISSVVHNLFLNKSLWLKSIKRFVLLEGSGLMQQRREMNLGISMDLTVLAPGTRVFNQLPAHWRTRYLLGMLSMPANIDHDDHGHKGC